MLSFAAGYDAGGSPLPSGNASGDSYSLSGLGTAASPTTLILGGVDDSYNKVWLQAMMSGTLNWTFAVSSEGGYDYGSLYKSSGPPSSTLPAGYTVIVGSSDGSYTTTGTLTIAQGEFLILSYLKDSSVSSGTDTVTFSGYIVAPTPTPTPTNTPTPTPTSTPTPTMSPVEAGFVVSGAGSSAFNGTYCPDGILNGKTRYKLAGSNYTIEYTNNWVVNNEENYGPTWLIQSGNSNWTFTQYYNISSSDTPPLSGWATYSASSPAPTLSSTMCSPTPTPTPTATPTPTPSTAVFTAFPAINSYGRSFSGVGTSVATLTKDPNAAAGANGQKVFFTVSEPCICLWQSSVLDPDPLRSSENMVVTQYTSFQPFDPSAVRYGRSYALNLSFNEATGYRHQVDSFGRFRSCAWELFQAGTYAIVLSNEGNNSVEGTFSLIQSPAIMRFSSYQDYSRPTTYWTQSTGKQVVFDCRTSGSCSFSLAESTTLTITRPSNPNYVARFSSRTTPIPNATTSYDKDGNVSYILSLSSTDTTISISLQAGSYSCQDIPGGKQLTFTIT